MVEIKEGDFVVDRGSYLIEVRKAVKVTDRCYYYVGYRVKPIRKDRHSVVFAGTRDAANRLCEQLTESRKQQYAEEVASREAREKRDEELIAAAMKS